MVILRHTDAGPGSPATEPIEERLAAVEGAEAARIVLARYADAVDAQDLGAASALLDRAMVLSIGDLTVDGFDDVVEFLRGAFADDPSRKSHFVTNMAPRWLGDGNVHIDAYFLWTGGAESQSIIGWGTYSARVKVRDGVGQLTKLEIAIRHMGDIREGWMFGTESE